MIFTEEDYWRLHELIFQPDYPGYKPDVAELPNGDGKIDATKRYAHVAVKYFKKIAHWIKLEPYLELAHSVAVRAAIKMDVPFEFLPVMKFSALRVLEYPPGAGSHRHTDFDLFTLMCYRDQPDRFRYRDHNKTPATVQFEALCRVNPQGHMGELGEAIGLGPATPHEVATSDTPQHSIVYFAIPDHEAVLPSGVKVGDWLAERLARSRTYR